MKTYHVKQGTQGRLVHNTLKKEHPHVLREDKSFAEDADVVFTPLSMWETYKIRCREYGFRTGTPEQREKFVFVVASKDVIEEDDEPADFD